MLSPLPRLPPPPRLHQPFPELQQLAMSFQLQEVDDLTHKHIPFGGSAAGWQVHEWKRAGYGS
jgi:hypothetical protein